MNHLGAGEHIHCLDLLRVTSSPGGTEAISDCAILLEIWPLGGLLQTNLAIPEDTDLSIPSVGVLAKVEHCQQDDFGFLVEISVDSARWFPEGYVPPHVLLDSPVVRP
jgi:hypothetical protein